MAQPFGDNVAVRTTIAFLAAAAGLGAAAAPACQPADRRAYGTLGPKHAADTLWINNSTEPESIDPGLCSESAGSQLAANLFAGLTDFDPATLQPVADIAERWEIDAAQTTYTFYLRPSAWSDGRPVRAGDFVYSWLRVLDPRTASRNASMLYVLQGAQARHQGWLVAPGATDAQALRQALARQNPDLDVTVAPRAGAPGAWVWCPGKPQACAELGAHPVAVGGQKIRLRPAGGADVGLVALTDRILQVRLERPVPYFLQLCAHTTMRPVPQHVLGALAQAQVPEALWTRPEHIACNGAFCLESWQFRQALHLVKNPHYWGAFAVALNHIKILEVEGAQTALNLYRTGDLDWLGANTGLPSAYLPTLRRYHDLRQYPLLSVNFYWFNTRVKPFDDVRVRQALSLAVDREALIKRILQGGQVATASLVPDGLLGYQALPAPLFDAPRARALLAEAGYPQGRGLPAIALSYNTADSHRQIAEALQAMWATHLGIEVRLENQEWRVFLQQVQSGQFALARMGWIGDYPDANNFLHEVLSQQSGNNLSGLQNPAFEAKLAEANGCADANRRLLLLRDAEALAMAQQPMLPLFVASYATLVKPFVRGFVGNMLNHHSYKHLAIATSSDVAGGSAPTPANKASPP